MTEKEFVIWLHGFLEISGVKTLDENQLQVIKDHLNVFFTKISPNREKYDLLEEQREMRTPLPIYSNWPTIPKIWCSDNDAPPSLNYQTHC
jgi:glutaredoxin-related protein